MVYYAFLVFGIALFAAACLLCIKMILKLNRIKKAQKKELAEHPEAHKVFTEKGTIMVDSFIIIAFIVMAILEAFVPRSADQASNPGLVLVMVAISIFYLAQVIRTLCRGTLIIGRHFFMAEDEVFRFRDIVKSENYRNRIYIHFKDGKIADLSVIQAEYVQEASKKSGTYRKKN